MGNVTIDLVNGKREVGGAIAYAAAVASAWGVRACIVTAAGPDADLGPLAGHDVVAVPADKTLTFEHSYTFWGNQRKLRVPAQPNVTLVPSHVPPRCRRAKVLLLGPLMPQDMDCEAFVRSWDRAGWESVHADRVHGGRRPAGRADGGRVGGAGGAAAAADADVSHRASSSSNESAWVGRDPGIAASVGELVGRNRSSRRGGGATGGGTLPVPPPPQPRAGFRVLAAHVAALARGELGADHAALDAAIEETARRRAAHGAVGGAAKHRGAGSAPSATSASALPLASPLWDLLPVRLGEAGSRAFEHLSSNGGAALCAAIAAETGRAAAAASRRLEPLAPAWAAARRGAGTVLCAVGAAARRAAAAYERSGASHVRAIVALARERVAPAAARASRIVAARLAELPSSAGFPPETRRRLAVLAARRVRASLAVARDAAVRPLLRRAHAAVLRPLVDRALFPLASVVRRWVSATLSALLSPPRPVIGLMSQGLQRSLDSSKRVVFSKEPSPLLEAALSPNVVVFMSDVETDVWPKGEVDRLARSAAGFVVTRGADGADEHTPASTESRAPARHPPSKVANVVDTNGAGDSFATSWILALAEGHSDPSAVANWAGGAAVSKPQSCKPLCVADALQEMWETRPQSRLGWGGGGGGGVVEGGDAGDAEGDAVARGEGQDKKQDPARPSAGSGNGIDFGNQGRSATAAA